MIPKEINQITEQELQSLVDNCVLESRTLEYKQELTIHTDKEKIEFLRNVSSFANASGGDLIFGIIENRDTDTPEKLEGLDIQNMDLEIRKIEDIIRYGIEPRIHVEIYPVPLKTSKTILIIRIFKSLVSPHRVVYKGDDKFYA